MDTNRIDMNMDCHALSGKIASVADFDNDGDLDIFCAEEMSVFILENDGLYSGLGYFTPIANYGISSYYQPADITVLDYNLDGFQDMLVGLNLKSLRGANNTSGIGARVEVTAGLKTYTQIIDGGSGFASQHETGLVFGLGHFGGAVSAQVTWPNGHVQNLPNLGTEQYHAVFDDSPVIDTSSIGFQLRYHFDSDSVDWIFTWTTFNSSQSALDKVVFDVASVPSRCWPGRVEIYEELINVTVSIEPLGQGQYRHTLTYGNVDCEPNCFIPFSVESAVDDFVSTSDFQLMKIRSCPVSP